MRNKLKLLLLALPIMMLAVGMPLQAQSSSSSGSAAAGASGGGGSDEDTVTQNFLFATHDSGDNGDNVDEGDSVPFDGNEVINGTAISRSGDTVFLLQEVGCYQVIVTLLTDPENTDDVTVRLRRGNDNFGPTVTSENNGATMIINWVVCVDDPTLELEVRVTDGTLHLGPNDSAQISIVKISNNI